MSTETRLYDDGTEPDVIKRWCCDGRCEQGRNCPGAPAPAEACTELGASSEDNAPEILGAIAVAAVLVAVVVVTVLLLR